MGSWLQPNWIHYWVTTNHVDTEKSLTQMIKATIGLEFYFFYLTLSGSSVQGKSWKLRWGQNFFGKVFGKQWTWNLEFILRHFTYICNLLKVGQILNFLYSYFNIEGLRLERKKVLCSLRDISLSQLSLIRLISPSVMAQELSQFKRYSRFTKRNGGHPELRNCNLIKHFFELHVQVFCNFFGGWGLGKNGGTWQCAGVLAVHYCTSSACDRKSCDRKLLLNGFHSHLSKFAPQHRDLL